MAADLMVIVVEQEVEAITVGEPGPPGGGGADGAPGPPGSTAWEGITDKPADLAQIVVSDTDPGNPAAGRYWFRPRDVIPPTITSFLLPESASSLIVDITSLTASDDRGVTGFYVSESPVQPGVGQAGWMADAPTTFTFGGQGSRTLYAWAKDAAGNVSAAASDSVAITLPNQAPGASITASNQATTGFTAAGVVYGIGAGDAISKIRVAWMLQGVDADPDAAVAAGRYSDLTSGVDLSAYQGSGKAISATMVQSSYIPAVQVTENMSGGGTQAGEWVTGAAFVVSLTAPTGVAASANAAGSRVDVSWSASPGATSYDLYWTSNSDTPTKASNKIAGVTSPYAHTGLTNGLTYKYGVVAVDAGGESVISAIVSAVPAVDGESTVWTENFADLTAWTNPIDGAAAFTLASGWARGGGAVMRRPAAVGRKCSVESKVKRGNASSTFRIYLIDGTSVTGTHTGYFVVYEPNLLRLVKATNGSGVNLGSGYNTTLTAGVEYTVKMELLADGTIKVYLDGVERISQADNSYTTFNNVALYVDNPSNPTDFDDVVVKN